MSRAGRSFPLHPITRSISRPYAIPSITLSLSTIGHLTIAGKTVTMVPSAVPTKVSFAITQAWNNALYASQSSVWWAVHTWNPATQEMGDRIAHGNSETTDVDGLIEATTTALGHFIGDDVIVTFGEIGGGPAGADVIGNSVQQLQSA